MINTESDYLAALAAIEPYLQKGFDNLNPEEDKELARITALIEAYEAIYYPTTFKPKTLIEVIERKMSERKMKQKDLAKSLDITENRISEVLNGKRKINMDLAKRIHRELKIDAKFILENA